MWKLWTAKALNGGNNASLNVVDENKMVKRIKRHAIVDKNGFLIAVMVTIVCMTVKSHIC